MSAEFIITNWLLEKLQEESLISETISDSVKKRILQSLSMSEENSELESKTA